ncbi:alkaline phosphatase family protein [Halovivax limisalsi]|uniref:alkaline phosphatase family protein n=1 Tax=Halovivax limisalsi TaxID=1453760 RepID=UPI001FFCEAB6|nr:alkaline phosphatase family protein [Halovivax limisalsi]
MDRQDLVAELCGDDSAFVEPAYDEYCVADAAETSLSLLDSATFDRSLPDAAFRGVETDVETVVFVLLDGFGYDEWTRFEGRRTLASRLQASGAVTPLTSVYPSETAAAFTSIATGCTPVEHGLLGWFQYLRAIDRDVVTLPFTALDETPLSDVEPAIDASVLFDARPLSARAAKSGSARTPSVSFDAVQPEAIADSAFSRAIFEGAKRLGYEDRDAFAGRLRERAEAADGPAFVFGYEPSIDAVAHEEGLASRPARRTMGDVLASLQADFVDALSAETASKTLLVVTADHGLVDVPPGENVDVTDRSCWPALRECARTDGSGRPRRPTGSPRNLHLHVEESAVDRARHRLESAVDGRVYTKAGAVEADLFGPANPSALFDRRCGDLVAIHRDRGCCWRDVDLANRGLHGGLTRAEMLVPFAAARVDALRD